MIEYIRIRIKMKIKRIKNLLVILCVIGMHPPLYSQSIDPKIHSLCKEAKDYEGCVKSMTNSKTNIEGTTTIRVVEGERELTGNSCPLDMAYIGAGWCNDVICYGSDGNEQTLGGKKWSCKPITFWGLRRSLRYGYIKVKATYDPTCPKTPPSVGWRSSCEERDAEVNTSIK